MWSGTAFECNNANNDIVILHSRFISPDPNLLPSCNNETVVAQGLFVEHNRYTSQLNITIDFSLIGKNITCAHDNGTVTHIIVGYHTFSRNEFTCSNNSDVKGMDTCYLFIYQ